MIYILYHSEKGNKLVSLQNLRIKHEEQQDFAFDLDNKD